MGKNACCVNCMHYMMQPKARRMVLTSNAKQTVFIPHKHSTVMAHTRVSHPVQVGIATLENKLLRWFMCTPICLGMLIIAANWLAGKALHSQPLTMNSYY